MVSCFMLHSGQFQNAMEALNFYGQKRTTDRKGVTIPSQRRYVNYYASLVRDKLEYRPVKLIVTLLLQHVPKDKQMGVEMDTNTPSESSEAESSTESSVAEDEEEAWESGRIP
ncbi:Phosphoric monoester hydrolase [Sarracenia purpurea var. burkii]